ncbi:sulfite oxidase heme-binding subunit YedZ [Leeia oryzae]|uniref:sulfite oxidase heme-binding subunit YedZ n=1 Tax=Leeia oryzae TaxID=356662 RepID=UPI0003A62A13|nr:protein-methionine-sulfoxide reductase heme-binding subunit MsrQ [Leeia oryzae]
MKNTSVASPQRHWTRTLKWFLWPLLLAPLLRIGGYAWSDIYHGTLLLSANPIEFIIRSTGRWGLTWLLTAIAITPLCMLTGRRDLVRVRRLIGLFGFFYISLHLSLYVWLEKMLDVQEVLHDIAKRPFILVGMLGWLLLVPLAATSTQWSIRKLGGRRWKLLHRLAYICPALGVLHFFWLVKADLRTPSWFALALACLLAPRLKQLYLYLRRPSATLKPG